MFTMLSKTVAISVIMCCTLSFAQADTEANNSEIPNPSTISQVQTTDQQATLTPVQTSCEYKEKNQIRHRKTIQSMNFSLPIESERWKIKPQRFDWKSIGYQFSWTRYGTEENGYSSVFGLGIGFLTGDLEDNIDMKGLDFNIKVGLGMAPISNNLIIAFHFICGLDLKIVEGDISVQTDARHTYKFTHGSAYIDAFFGGDLIIGYHIFESLGFISGVDITTNAYGIGAYYTDLEQKSKVYKMSYLFTGVNITPHIGLFFLF